MSTAPETEPSLTETLNALLQLAQALKATSTDAIETVESLLNQRAVVLEQLQSAIKTALTPEQQAQVREQFSKIQAIDAETEARWRSEQGNRSQTLGQMARAQQALASYQFPTTTQSGHIENRG